MDHDEKPVTSRRVLAMLIRTNKTNHLLRGKAFQTQMYQPTEWNYRYLSAPMYGFVNKVYT